MKISHNLRAALEYDEQTRGASDNTSAPSSRRPSLTADSSPGLPPPPRPKSQASLHKSKSPPMSPTAPLTGLQDTAQAASSSGPESITPTTANPYINPPPRLSHLLVENSTALAHNRSFSLPDSSPRSRENSPRTSESPRSDAPHASPVQVSSPESSGASAGPEVRSSFQRHLRYLSSLQRVEKILVKGKTRAVGKAADGRARDARDGRRGSVGGSPEACDRDTMGREGQAAAGRRRRIRAGGRAEASEAHALGASSAPTSPTGTMSRACNIYSAAGVVVGTVADRPSRADTAVERAEPSGGAAGRRRASRRSVGLLPDADPAAGIGRLPLRPLISHARRASQASTAAGSDESHDPPNTPREARISVSSTVYHDDRYSVHDFAPADAPLTPPYPPSAAATPTTATMPDSDRESFIDLASPTFSPRLTDFSSNSSFAAHGKDYHHPYATIPDNSDAPPASRAKPTLPSISTITTKPPVPTAPKPNFNRRSRSVQPPTTHHDEGPDSPSVQEITYTRGLPPTTNLLHPHERAEGVRKTRKIAQVFGHTPAAPEALSISQVSFEASVPNGLLCAPAGLGAKRSLKHHRGAVSMSVAPGGDAAPQPLWPPPEPDASRYAALSTRRHSTPLTPETFSFMDDDELSPSESRRTSESGSRHSSALIEVGSQQGTPYSEWSGHVGRGRASVGPTSPTSFMDLSEEELLADGVSSLISIETPKDDRRPGVLKSSSSSIYSFTSEDLAEEDRRRKREKLAKLHRFLGSRVPADLVLGQLSLDAVAQDLPPVVPISAVDPPSKHMDGEGRKNWVRRRRSSSVGELGGRWQDDLDRLKEELNNKEKALNVKRAVKMEKVRMRLSFLFSALSDIRHIIPLLDVWRGPSTDIIPHAL